LDDLIKEGEENRVEVLASIASSISNPEVPDIEKDSKEYKQMKAKLDDELG